MDRQRDCLICFEFCSWLPEELMISWCLLLPAPLLPPITWPNPSFMGTVAPKGQLLIIP